MNIIEQIEKEQLRDDIPDFSPGDTVVFKEISFENYKNYNE